MTENGSKSNQNEEISNLLLGTLTNERVFHGHPDSFWIWTLKVAFFGSYPHMAPGVDWGIRGTSKWLALPKQVERVQTLRWSIGMGKMFSVRG